MEVISIENAELVQTAAQKTQVGLNEVLMRKVNAMLARKTDSVQATIARMEAEGKLHRVMGGGSREVIYRYSGAHTGSQCLHLSCKKCGKTVHMQQQLADRLVDSVAQNNDFAIDKGETVIYGVCAACQKSQTE